MMNNNMNLLAPIATKVQQAYVTGSNNGDGAADNANRVNLNGDGNGSGQTTGAADTVKAEMMAALTAMDAATMCKWLPHACPSTAIVKKIALSLSSVAQEGHQEDNNNPPVACC